MAPRRARHCSRSAIYINAFHPAPAWPLEKRLRPSVVALRGFVAPRLQLAWFGFWSEPTQFFAAVCAGVVSPAGNSHPSPKVDLFSQATATMTGPAGTRRLLQGFTAEPATGTFTSITIPIDACGNGPPDNMEVGVPLSAARTLCPAAQSSCTPNPCPLPAC
jgi:hypothetical protein